VTTGWLVHGALEWFAPDALVVLVGASGSGKSTWAAQLFRADQVLSSDAFRELVSGDAADQSATREAFRLLHAAARARLRRGLLCVIDATNLTSGSRRGLLRLAREAGRPTVAVVFDVPLERCLAQNARRAERRVPEAVVRRHVAQLAEARRTLDAEGFGTILTIALPTSEASSTTVGRGTATMGPCPVR
jgi:protein phosphatase